MGHSDIGPSSADRWMACPGSVRLSRGLPRGRSSSYAAWGTVCHGLGEELLTGKVTEMDLMLRVGEVIEEDGNDITIDEEMVQVACGYAANAQRDFSELSAVHKPQPVHKLIEQKVCLDDVDPDLYGTLDWAVYRVGDTLIVRDLKTGKGKKVYAEKNKQLGIYALGVIRTHAINLAALDKVELVIDQPRAGGEDRWVAPREWLVAFKEEVKAAIEATRKPDAPLAAGEWCRWCKAQAVCPEIVAATEREVQADFNAAPPQALTATPLEGVPVARLVRILDWEPTVKGLIGAAYLRVQQLLESGVAVPGYKLVEGRVTRRWGDGTGEEAAQLFAPQYGDKVYAPRKVLSVAQMETLVGKKAFAGAAGHLVVKPEPPRKVAPADDRRPETCSSAEADFSGVGHIIEGEVVHGDPLFGAAEVVKALPVDDPFFGAPAAAPNPTPAALTVAPRKIWP